MPARGGFVTYIRTAFLWHWNLLALGAGAVFSFLSGQPDTFLPIFLAAEILYLGLLATHPRFQKAVDASLMSRQQPLVNHAEIIEQIRQRLTPPDWNRFEQLRDRCLSLNRIAEQIRGPQAGNSSPIHSMQTDSLERLLWLFLKLLYSRDALQRFLSGTDKSGLEAQIHSAQREIQDATTNQRTDKLIRTLEDKHDTLMQRLANYQRAEENREILAAEIDRIEQKVNAISELSISARDPADVSAQVDGIAEGVSVTEEAIRKLDVPPLFDSETAPRFLTQTE